MFPIELICHISLFLCISDFHAFVLSCSSMKEWIKNHCPNHPLWKLYRLTEEWSPLRSYLQNPLPISIYSSHPKLVSQSHIILHDVDANQAFYFIVSMILYYYKPRGKWSKKGVLVVYFNDPSLSSLMKNFGYGKEIIFLSSRERHINIDLPILHLLGICDYHTLITDNINTRKSIIFDSSRSCVPPMVTRLYHKISEEKVIYHTRDFLYKLEQRHKKIAIPSICAIYLGLEPWSHHDTFVEYSHEDLRICDAVVIDVCSVKESLAMGEMLKENLDNTTIYYVVNDKITYCKIFYGILCQRFNLPLFFGKEFLKMANNDDIIRIMRKDKKQKFFNSLLPLIQKLCREYKMDEDLFYSSDSSSSRVNLILQDYLLALSV